jgi:hypothetical protein
MEIWFGILSRDVQRCGIWRCKHELVKQIMNSRGEEERREPWQLCSLSFCRAH